MDHRSYGECFELVRTYLYKTNINPSERFIFDFFAQFH
jgi:hypothetical protein